MSAEGKAAAAGGAMNVRAYQWVSSSRIELCIELSFNLSLNASHRVARERLAEDPARDSLVLFLEFSSRRRI